eukprot:7001-Prymnesium_polylepis.1
MSLTEERKLCSEGIDQGNETSCTVKLDGSADLINFTSFSGSHKSILVSVMVTMGRTNWRGELPSQYTRMFKYKYETVRLVGSSLVQSAPRPTHPSKTAGETGESHFGCPEWLSPVSIF